MDTAPLRSATCGTKAWFQQKPLFQMMSLERNFGPKQKAGEEVQEDWFLQATA